MANSIDTLLEIDKSHSGPRGRISKWATASLVLSLLTAISAIGASVAFAAICFGRFSTHGSGTALVEIGLAASLVLGIPGGAAALLSAIVALLRTRSGLDGGRRAVLAMIVVAGSVCGFLLALELVTDHSSFPLG